MRSFKNYTFKGLDISPTSPEAKSMEDNQMFFIDTKNFYITAPVYTKPKPWIAKMWHRFKGAWSLIRHGDDYYD